MIFSEELPSLPLYYPVYNYAVDDRVQGIRMGPMYDNSDRFNTITDWNLAAIQPRTITSPTAQSATKKP